MKSYILVAVAVLFFQTTNAQVKKFGKVSKKEFSIKDDKKYAEDDAIVLFKKYDAHYSFDQNTGWRIITKVHERILLKNKDGFKYATKRIGLFRTSGSKETTRIKATTYNLIDNKIVKTNLDKKSIYDQKDTKNIFERKFTMPNLKEGSIIEWSYKIESPFISNIKNIIYKSQLPIKYLEAEVSIPEFYHYKYFTTPFFPVRMEESQDNMSISITQKNVQHAMGWNQRQSNYEYKDADVILNVYKLRLKDIEPIDIEPYMNSINNYIGKISFELSYVKYPNSIPKFLSTTWEDVCKTVYNSSDFGSQLKKTKYFEKDLSTLVSKDEKPEVKINKILAFVKKKVRWNRVNQISANEGVKKAYKNGTGNVAEVNFILIAMLRKAGLEAYPVLASTNEHGTPLYPTLNGFNYVVTAVKLGDSYLLIDPTEKYAPAGVLPKRVLNWQGRLVKKDGVSESIELFPKIYSLANKIIKAKINDEQEIQGFSTEKYTGNIALYKRNEYEKISKEDIIKDYEDTYNNLNVDNIRVSKIENINKPFKVMMQFNMEDEVEEVGNKLMFSPVLFLRDNENIFKSDKRDFPIYFGYPYKSDYVINIVIPESYEITKMPEDINLSLPENSGTYSYHIEKTDNGLKLTVSNAISAAIIPNTLYKELKDFFEKIFNKENEKVILSKK